MKNRIEELVKKLNEASKEYYSNDREIMSNREYDALYDELLELEKKTGITMSNSPTVRVGYEAAESLPKEQHPSPMLSLDKTKSVDELASWLGSKEGILSWKLDGLTVVLTYEDGRLEKAVTRGDGTTGEVITNNAKVFENIPLTIPHKGKMVLRGEAVISYSDFEDFAGEYKNPRNLCSGSVRQLNNEITASRHVSFYGFSMSEGPEFEFRREQLKWLEEQGFQVVESVLVDAKTIAAAVQGFADKIANYDIPSDGLVLAFDDINYGKSLGMTAKFPRDSIAFKWQDEMRQTRLENVLWNASRTGLINPIAVFEPVELEGTTVSRASVHNVSIVEELALGIGDLISVYKANMIIPQIEQNLTKSGTIKPPENCPVCGAKTQIHDVSGIKTLHCPNEECPAKRVKAFTHFVSRNAMNIEGLSEATLEKLIDRGIVRDFADLFKLSSRREDIVELEGFGDRSFDKLVEAANKASHTTPDRILYALGIPGIGAANGKMIAKACQNSWQIIESLSHEDLVAIEGIGDIMAQAYTDYFANERNRDIVANLLDVLNMDESFTESATVLGGKTFVITGSLEHFENREACKTRIEELGGKVAGSVSKKTDYLINNDINSNSSKNKKAKELGVPIITENDFLILIGE